MSYTIKNFDSIVADMTSWVLNHAPQITDLSPGSIIRSYLEAAALAIEESNVAYFVGLRRSLATVAQDKFNFARLNGSYASASVYFTASSAPATDIVIPTGTRVQTSAGLIFDTTTDATISAGHTDSTSNGYTGVTAEKVGVAYNVSGLINTMKDDVVGVTGVTQHTDGVGGTDAETDSAYLSRFKVYIDGLGRCNISGVITGATSVSGITSAYPKENYPSAGTVTLYVDNGSPTGTPSTLVTQVQSVIDGDGTSTNPGYRPVGIAVTVAAAPVLTQNFNLTVYATSASVDGITLETDVINSITQYVNNLPIGNTAYYAELISSVTSVYGVKNVTFATPSADVVPSSGQVVRVGTFTITIS